MFVFVGLFVCVGFGLLFWGFLFVRCWVLFGFCGVCFVSFWGFFLMRTLISLPLDTDMLITVNAKSSILPRVCLFLVTSLLDRSVELEKQMLCVMKLWSIVGSL